MQIKCADLPGIGRKYTIYPVEGSMFVIIIHHTGRREIYFMRDEDDDEPLLTFELNDEEARKVGAILLGVDYQPVSGDRLDTLLKNIRIEWIQVAPRSEVANRKIKDTRIRTITGATVIGIQRGDEIIGSPDVEEALLPGDVLMAIGKRAQTKALESMCTEQEH
ncbi:MAG: cation:proton antiporter regulatory subunit [Candidatus Desulforudis sp.]|nr:cation:proton antiporter regulatory subunit [Desulforudis sp.]